MKVEKDIEVAVTYSPFRGLGGVLSSMIEQIEICA